MTTRCRSRRMSARSASTSTAFAPSRSTTGRNPKSARMMERLPQGDFLVELGKRWKDSFKEFVYHSMIWEELGFTYVGPVDGHDIRATDRGAAAGVQGRRTGLRPRRDPKGHGLRSGRAGPRAGPCGLRHRRAKGHDGAPASAAEVPGRLRRDPDRAGQDERQDRRDHRGDAVRDVAWTSSSRRYPDRFFDVGIAEQHAVTFAAGLATQGMQAGLRDLLDLPAARLRPDRPRRLHPATAGRLRAWTAPDSPATTAGRITASSTSPTCAACRTWSIMAPKDENELRHMIKTAIEHQDGPIAVRYPRGAGVGCRHGRAAPCTCRSAGRRSCAKVADVAILVGSARWSTRRSEPPIC